MNLNAMLMINNRYIYIIFCVLLGFSVKAQVIPYDGYGNNISNPTFGSVLSTMERIAPADYVDGVSIPRSGVEYNRINARTISNLLFDQIEETNNNLGLSSYVWAFGQFISHDIALTEVGDEFSPIYVEESDEFFSEGEAILFSRSTYDAATGEVNGTARSYQNGTTAFVDGSVIYGNNSERASWLRSYNDGKLKVSTDNLLPWNTVSGQFSDVIDTNAPKMSSEVANMNKYYVAGDTRANENPILISIHTIFVREHNRLCDEILSTEPDLSDEVVYQKARTRVIAQLQNITFNEWLPTIGINIAKYSGYKPEVVPNVFNEFISAAFQLNHTLASSQLIRMNDGGEEINKGNIDYDETLYNPLCLNLAGGVEPYLKGLATQVLQDYDHKIVDELRNYTELGDGFGLDFAAINIERGRDRGLSDFNTLRSSLGMPMISSFSNITEDVSDVLLLKEIYGDVNNIDAYVGMLSERHVDGSLFGEVVNRLIFKQFQSLRDGDRFYFENLEISEFEKEIIRETGLRDILMRNTGISLMQDDIFRAMPHVDIEKGPAIISYPLTAVVYPNPVLDEANIKLFSDLETSITITILDGSGKTIKTMYKHVYSGINFIYLKDLNSMTVGTYNILIESGNRFNVVKMIKI